MTDTRFELVVPTDDWSTETLDAFVAELLRVAEQYASTCHVEVPLFGGDMGMSVKRVKR